MGEILSYSTISGLSMLVLYLAYRVLLSRDNQHGFNRCVLLCIYLVSFMTPLIIPVSENISGQSSSVILAFDTIGNAAATAVSLSKPIWGTILIWLFVAGMITVAIKTAIIWVRLVGVIRSGKKIVREGYTLVVTENEKFAPFSWMHYIVICRTDYENSCSAIIAHELKHIVSRHWIDLLIAQAVCIINWFNPAAWLMRDELMLIHEYQADMAVIDSGRNVQEYQMLLIKKAVGSRFPSLANSLNHSKLKKRITMMYKEKSGAGRKLKALALVPVPALVLVLAGVPAVRAAVSTISNSEVSVGKGSKKLPEREISVQRYKVASINNDGKKTIVVIRGENLGSNLTVSGGTFTNNGRIYKANALNCEMSDGTATITATFPFSEKYKNPKMTLSVNGEEIPFLLEEFFNNSQSVVVGSNAGSSKSTITINGKSSSMPVGMKIFLDGKEIGECEMPDTDNIASVTVDRRSNSIRITTRK